MTRGFCTFHQRGETLVKAHILPAALYHDDGRFGGFAALIKVGEGQMPDGFDAMRLAPGQGYIAQTPFTGSRWEDAARRALLNADPGSSGQDGS